MKGLKMAITLNAPIKATSLAVGNQVVLAAAADGHCYVYPAPTTGNQYPLVRAIFPAALPSNDSTAGDVLFTVQLTGAPFTLPQDFTINGNTDWVVTATGTA